jgi:hypothetical protein
MKLFLQELAPLHVIADAPVAGFHRARPSTCS